MNEPSERENAICEAALALPTEHRGAYLDKVCAADAQFRQRVDALIQAREHPSATSGEPAPASPVAKTIVFTLPPIEKAGDRIGRYKLLQQIGEGGCGVVYMAEQEEPVRRRVALKVIKLGMDTKSVIARFEAERQALAMMDHPNIARVLDAGATENGRPFFVMELVRGIKITDYCDQNKLNTRERLALFTSVCHAIQHAHQKGIIHRDIKPSNILVTMHDGVPVPKVIDFGIAKATQGRLTEQTLFTAFEQFIGTPAYMSPEQAEMSGLDIDTRSDIYALGVLLYELLTGKTPFDAKELLASGLDMLRRTIREKEPERPSTRISTMLAADLDTTALHRHTDAPKLVHLLRGDLDWVVMKALEKDRTRRYETANALAMDIQRHLTNEPVLARPPSAVYRFQKLVRRNKAAVAAVGAVMVVLLLGVVVSSYLFVKEREALREQARLLVEAQAGRALEAKMRVIAEQGKKYTEAGFLLSQGEYEKAERTVNDIISPEPVSAAIFNVLGQFHAQRGEWRAAISNYSQVVRFQPNEHLGYHFLAPLLAQTGDYDAFRHLGQKILERFGNTTNPVIAERMAKDLLTLPPAGADLPAIQRLADLAVTPGTNHPSWLYLEFCKGLSEYRSGHYQNAVEWLQKVAPDESDPRRAVSAYMVMAMAQRRLELVSAARDTLATGLALVAKDFRTIDKDNRDGLWNDWIIAEILMREARELVEAK